MNFKQFLMEDIFQSVGTLDYIDPDKLVVWVSPGLRDIYTKGSADQLWSKARLSEKGRRAERGIPPSIDINVPYHDPHITVVRTGMEKPDPDAWEKQKQANQGRDITFEYESEYVYNEPTFSLKVYSKELEKLRQELGLPATRAGFTDFHITLANNKNLPKFDFT